MTEKDELIALQLKTMHADVTQIKTSLDKLTEAITKLALIEERQAHAATAQERAFRSLENIERRVSTLEVSLPNTTRIGAWVDRGLWAMAAAAAVYIGKKTGLF
jgi:transcription elongation GreA/GreB family factor